MENIQEYPKQIQVIYAGKRQASHNSIFEQFYYFDGKPGQSLIFDKIKYRFILGGVYEITQKSEITFVLIDDKFIKQIPELNLEYKIMHIAANEAYNKFKKLKNLKDANPVIEDIVKPLKEISYKLTREQRKALLAYLIDLLT